MSRSLTLAYLAGVIDADGFVSAHRHKREGKVYCAPLIGIAGTSSEPHLLAQSVWGGSFFKYVPKNPSHRVQFQWQCVGIRAANAINDILPYLRCKIAQADIALEMWAMIVAGMHRTDRELFDKAAQLSVLNFRNPPKKPLGVAEAT